MQKKAFKGCAIAFIVVLALIIVDVCTLPMIIKTVEQNEKNKQINSAEIIGNYILDGIADDSLSVETIYYINPDLSYHTDYNPLPTQTDEIKEIIDSEKFVYAYALNENYVLISEGATFQQVTGYVVTNGDEEIGDHIEVPEEFGYDGDTVSIDTEVKENIYSFYGGV